MCGKLEWGFGFKRTAQQLAGGAARRSPARLKGKGRCAKRSWLFVLGPAGNISGRSGRGSPGANYQQPLHGGRLVPPDKALPAERIRLIVSRTDNDVLIGPQGHFPGQGREGLAGPFLLKNEAGVVLRGLGLEFRFAILDLRRELQTQQPFIRQGRQDADAAHRLLQGDMRRLAVDLHLKLAQGGQGAKRQQSRTSRMNVVSPRINAAPLGGEQVLKTDRRKPADLADAEPVLL